MNPYGSLALSGYVLVLMDSHILLLLQSQIHGLFPFWDCRFKSPTFEACRSLQQKSPDQVGTGLIRIWPKLAILLQHRVQALRVHAHFTLGTALYPKTLQWASSQWWLSFLFRNCTTQQGALQISSQPASQLVNSITLGIHILPDHMLIFPPRLSIWAVRSWQWQSHAMYVRCFLVCFFFKHQSSRLNFVAG